MRRIRRDTAGGGEIAMMAVITKAMGAFLVLMIFLLPYYTVDPVAQRTADQATEDVEQAREKLQQAQDKLKKGRLTDEEIDELIKQLEEAERRLEEALLNIRQLKLQVDHLTAQVKRLEAEVAELREENAVLKLEVLRQQKEIDEQKKEIEQLKEEIERLKRLQNPEQVFWNTVRVEWSGCTGARLNLYAVSSLPATNGAFNPPPDRTAQGPPFPHDKVSSEAGSFLAEGGRRLPMNGAISWLLDRLNVDETVTFYIKYLNALPDGPNECNLVARWGVRFAGTERPADTIRAKLTEKAPYMLLVRLKGGERGSLAPINVSAEEQDEFQKQIAASRCEGITCGLDDPRAKAGFVEAIVDRFLGKLVPDYLANVRIIGTTLDPTEGQRGTALLRVLGEHYAAKQLKYADVAKWVDILGEPMRGRGASSGVPERIREVYANRLQEAGAPEAVLEMFRHRVISGYYDMRAAATTMERAGIRRVDLRPNRAEDERVAAQLSENAGRDGGDPIIAVIVSRIVAEGRMKAEPARALIALAKEHRGGPTRDFSGTPGAAELQALLPQVVRSGPLLNLINPRSGKIPPDLSLPLIRQIEPY